MTSRGTWKNMERKIAKKLNTHRTPLSGENSRHTSSDTLHDDFFVEAKLRNDMSRFLNKEMRETLEETKESAKEEDKEWMIVFKEKYKHTNYVLLDFDTFCELIDTEEDEDD